MSAPRVPVIVGVGQVNEPIAAGEAGSDPVALARAALAAADRDGGGGWLGRLDLLAAVRQVSFPDIEDLASAVASHLAPAPRSCAQTELPGGTSVVRLLNDAANRILAGELRTVAIIGAEAFRTARARPGGGDFARSVERFSQFSPVHHAYELTTPTAVYPLYENATRARWKQSLAEGQDETATIWSLMSEVAAANPHAALPRRLSPDDILHVSETNRPIAFPYTKLMVANASVNQASAILVTDRESALAAGVAESRLVHIGRGAAASECRDPLDRESFVRSRSMEVSLRSALDLNEMDIARIRHVELYSCFPCIPKMARRILDWDVDRPVSVYGGLTFGGAPVGAAMGHAIARMTELLRGEGGAGLVFANSGFATGNHTIVLSSRAFPGQEQPGSYDLQSHVPPADPPRFHADYSGEGTIETYTVLHDGAGRPRRGIVVGRTPMDQRFLAEIPGEDEATLASLMSGQGEPIGRRGHAEPTDEGLARWRPA